jgi:hypothetical protein
MRRHPLDGEMRLAGIGRSQHGSDAAPGQDQWFRGMAGESGHVVRIQVRSRVTYHIGESETGANRKEPEDSQFNHWNSRGTNRRRINDSP